MRAPSSSPSISRSIPVSGGGFSRQPVERARLWSDRGWPDWPDTILLLVGPRGSGKSHLASIWATNARAWTIDASGITQDKVPHLVSNGALAIEDMDRGERDEAACSTS